NRQQATGSPNPRASLDLTHIKSTLNPLGGWKRTENREEEVENLKIEGHDSNCISYFIAVFMGRWRDRQRCSCSSRALPKSRVPKMLNGPSSNWECPGLEINSHRVSWVAG